MEALLNVLIFILPILIMALIISVMARLSKKNGPSLSLEKVSPYKYKTTYNTIFNIKNGTIMKDACLLMIWFCLLLYFVYGKNIEFNTTRIAMFSIVPFFYIVKKSFKTK